MGEKSKNSTYKMSFNKPIDKYQGKKLYVSSYFGLRVFTDYSLYKIAVGVIQHGF